MLLFTKNEPAQLDNFCKILLCKMRYIRQNITFRRLDNERSSNRKCSRTPIGSFGGSLKGVPAVELGAVAAKEAIKRAGIDPASIDEVILGNVLQGGLGQNIARQISMAAGIPKEVPSMTINKVCGSGLRAVALAAQVIKAGDADIVLAGGAENMSMSGYVVSSARWGARMGDSK